MLRKAMDENERWCFYCVREAAFSKPEPHEIHITMHFSAAVECWVIESDFRMDGGKNTKKGELIASSLSLIELIL